MSSLAYQRKWCAANREKRRRYAKTYYEKNQKQEYERLKKYKKTLKGYVVHLVAGLKQRCTNPNRSCYKNYGGRGVKVCFGSNELFIWLNKKGINPHGLEIHRPDFNGNYTLDNIEFLTKSKHTTLHNLKGH